MDREQLTLRLIRNIHPTARIMRLTAEHETKHVQFSRDFKKTACGYATGPRASFPAIGIDEHLWGLCKRCGLGYANMLTRMIGAGIFDPGAGE